MKEAVIVCLDIGGTNCRIGVVNAQYVLLDHIITPTAKLTTAHFLSSLTLLIENYLHHCQTLYDVKAISLGFPATVDRHRRRVLQAPNIASLPDDTPICDLLEQALGLPVFLERDVNLLLTYDLHALQLDKNSTTIGIYFGTGIGNCIYLGGKFYCGHNGVAGELGHIPQLGFENPCGCGNYGCLESLGGGIYLSQLCEKHFPDTKITEIYLRHSQTEVVMQQIEAMAIAVSTEVNILDPDYVVLGGGLLQMQGFPRDTFEEKIKAHTRKPYPTQNLQLIYSLPHQENGILGAGIYGWHCLKNKEII